MVVAKKSGNKKEIIEPFGSVSGFDDENGEFGLGGIKQSSFTKTAFCMGATGGGESHTKRNPARKKTRRKGDVSLVPNRDQLSTEYSRFNPVWLIFPIFNLFVDILLMVYEVFKFVFKIVFFQTYESIVPDEFNFGFKSGKKYCFNIMPFRLLITFLCPPMGVFMAYGVRGFVQIGICAVLSLLLYVPGLVYGLVVIMRSDVAEYMEQVSIGNCAEEGIDSVFTSDEDDGKPKCSRKPGEKCSVDGKPTAGNPKNLDCCMQPKYDKDLEKWIYDNEDKDEAKDYNGFELEQYSDGELKCKLDYHTKMAPTNGLCVYKKTGRPG